MKFTFAQINTKQDDLRHNSEKILKIIESNKSDLLIFPELSFIGSSSTDMLLNKNFLNQAEKIFHDEIIPKITSPCIIGSILKDQEGNFYNSIFTIKDSKIQKIINKKNLLDNSVFNDSRYFKEATESPLEKSILHINNKNILIYFYNDLLNEYKNFNTELKIDLIICPTNLHYEKHSIYDCLQNAKKITSKLNCDFILLNQATVNNGLIFYGSSFYMKKDASFKILKKFEEEVFVIDDKDDDFSVNIDEFTEDILEMKEALIFGIKDFFEKNNFKKAYIGLSGGVDSALVTCLAVKALGKENVSVLLMPSEYSSLGSIKDAEKLVQNLGIKKEIIPISPILEEILKAGNFPKLSLAEENTQARIRGMLLMAKANNDSALVLATGNKSELAAGYATLYGDTCGALEPIGDLWKLEVWEMAKTFKEIPLEIIQKPPSAELKPNQKDSDSLPEYHILDEILRKYIEENYLIEDLIKEGFKENIVLKVIDLLYKSEYKRKQGAGVLKLKKKSFALDWKY